MSDDSKDNEYAGLPVFLTKPVYPVKASDLDMGLVEIDLAKNAAALLLQAASRHMNTFQDPMQAAAYLERASEHAAEVSIKSRELAAKILLSAAIETEVGE